jgi:hypothetical protein
MYTGSWTSGRRWLVRWLGKGRGKMLRLQVEIRDNGDVVFRTEGGEEFLWDSETILAEELTERLEDEGIL